jgi:hypothetical protein
MIAIIQNAKKSRSTTERLFFYISQKSKTSKKKVTQTETIWAILVNSSTPIKCKDILFLYSMSREI